MLPEVEQMEMDLDEIQELDARKIIEAKLAEARKHHAGAFMAEDTSLYFDGMNGLPGPFCKWFLHALGLEGLVKLAQTFGTAARAITIIGYADENGSVEFFEGETRGTIVEPAGESKFGWDAIFKPEGSDKTYNDMSKEEKNNISHRGKALAKLKAYLGK